jgi:hypothetical protein
MDGISHTESFEDHSSAYFTETKVGHSNIMRLSTMMSGDTSPEERKVTPEDDESPIDSGVGFLYNSDLKDVPATCKVHRTPSLNPREAWWSVEGTEITSKRQIILDSIDGSLTLQRNLESGQGYGGFAANGNMGLNFNCARPQVVVESRREWDDDDSPHLLAVKKSQVSGYESPDMLSFLSMSDGEMNFELDLPTSKSPEKSSKKVSRRTSIAGQSRGALSRSGFKGSSRFKPDRLNTSKWFSVNGIVKLAISVTVWGLCLWAWLVLCTIEWATGRKL